MSKHPYRSTLQPSHQPLRSELAILAVIAVLLTYWTIMLVVGIGRADDGLGARVKGVVITPEVTTPSTTPPVTYQPLPAP